MALPGQLLAVFASLHASEASSHVADEIRGGAGLLGLHLLHVCAFRVSAPEKLTLQTHVVCGTQSLVLQAAVLASGFEFSFSSYQSSWPALTLVFDYLPLKEMKIRKIKTLEIFKDSS